MTVYVTQEIDADFSGAHQWGNVVFLTKDDLTNNPGSLINNGIANDIARKLEFYHADDDWIVIAGSPYVSALVFMWLGWNKARKYVHVLRWDNRDRIYRPCIIELL